MKSDYEGTVHCSMDDCLQPLLGNERQEGLCRFHSRTLELEQYAKGHDRAMATVSGWER